MAEFLVIRLQESPQDPVSWIAVDDRGARRGHPGSGMLEDAAKEIRERSVIVLVPATEALTLFVDIPAKGSRLLTALPFALEDQLADDIENLHFAAGRRREDGSIPVAVVTRKILADWLARLADAGIEADRITPENHGLARTPNTLSMLVSDDLVMFNDGAKVEFVIPDISPSEALAATGILDADSSDNSDNESGDNQKPPSRHLVVYCDAALADQYEKDWALLRHELSSVDVNLLPDGALPRLAVTVASGNGINLLQGRYGAKTEFTALFRPWRYAAIFLLAFCIVGFAGKAANYYRLSVENQALITQFTEEYRRIRPNDTREVVDPVGTVNSLRRSQGTTAAGPQVFLPSLQQLASAVGSNTAVTIEAISYRAGVVDVRLIAPDIPTLDKIVQAVSASGRFTASMQSADRSGEQVNSRIQIREAGA
ncbi:MAG: type II secretion system protein GspL [Gammaproteobacteria bacterium]|nr:type II secretion system protein GspL [Gammaproteobacteria bacterium]